MASEPSDLLGIQLQATGEGTNIWGGILNGSLRRLTESVAQVLTINVSGPVTLNNANYEANQARAAGFIFTGSGGTVTAPPKQKIYKVVNAATGPVTLTMGSGATVAFQAGESGDCVCDGSSFFKTSTTIVDVSQAFSATSTTPNAIGVGLLTYTVQSGRAFAAGMGVRISDTASPDTRYMTGTVQSYSGTTLVVSTSTAVGSGTPAQVTIAFAQAAVGLPSQTGQAGGVLTTNGTTASWQAPYPLAPNTVFAKKTDTFTTTSTTLVDIPGLSVTITPRFAASRIQVFAVVAGHNTTQAGYLTLLRGATPINTGDVAGSRVPATAVIPTFTGGAAISSIPIMTVDAPNTTDPVTYKVRVGVISGGTSYINRSATDTDAVNFIRSISTIFVTEVV